MSMENEKFSTTDPLTASTKYSSAIRHVYPRSAVVRQKMQFLFDITVDLMKFRRIVKK